MHGDRFRVDLHAHDAATGPGHPPHLVDDAGGGLHVQQQPAAEAAIEGAVRERQGLRAAGAMFLDVGNSGAGRGFAGEEPRRSRR